MTTLKQFGARGLAPWRGKGKREFNVWYDPRPTPYSATFRPELPRFVPLFAITSGVHTHYDIGLADLPAMLEGIRKQGDTITFGRCVREWLELAWRGPYAAEMLKADPITAHPYAIMSQAVRCASIALDILGRE